MSGLVGHIGLLLAAAVSGGGSGSTTTWNSADTTGPALVLSNGNLTWTDTNASAHAVRSTTGVSSGSWYWEEIAGVTDQGAMGIRVIGDAIGSAINSGTTCSLRSTGTLFASGGCSSAGGSAPAGYAQTDVVRFALKFLMDGTFKLWIAVGPTWPGSTDPATETGYTFTGPAGVWHAYNWSDNNATDCSATLNCGAVAFAYTPPAGFSAL